MESGEGSCILQPAAPGATAPTNSEPQPFIFLSHSGKQKDFVRELHRELLRARHYLFFDEDYERSLLPGTDFAQRILEACHGCKMAVVVLSHDFIKSLWPMLELQEFFRHNPDRLVYPLFYELEPHELANEKNLELWNTCWSKNTPRWQNTVMELQASSGSCDVRFDLHIHKWAENLKKLKRRSGKVRRKVNALDYQNMSEYIKEVVSEICSVFPPLRPYNVDDAIQGMDRMIQQEIVTLFNKQQKSNSNVGASEQSIMPIVGVYGIGGSGKSTLCRSLANFFSHEFGGKSWWLELPSDQVNGSMEFVNAIKHILKFLSVQHDVSTLDQVDVQCTVNIIHGLVEGDMHGLGMRMRI